MQELETLRNEVRRQRELLEQKRPMNAAPEAPVMARATTRRRLLGKLAALGLGGAATLGAGLAMPSSAQARLVIDRTNFPAVGLLAIPSGVTLTANIIAPRMGLLGAESNTDVMPFSTNSYAGVGGISRHSGGIGVVGIATSDDTISSSVYGGYKRGVVGIGNDTNAIGVLGYGIGDNSVGVYGTYSGNGTAGYFVGDVHVTGTMSATAKNFMIDHPLDPANQYLYHSCVESSELKTFYDGTVTLNERGESEVNLPAWFEALNKDLRYQLTCIGQSAPVYIAQTVQQAKFKIAGGQPGQQVCWQITGTRRDAYAEKYPLQVEVAKNGAEQGKYLHPELFGAPESLKIGREKKTETGSKK